MDEATPETLRNRLRGLIVHSKEPAISAKSIAQDYERRHGPDENAEAMAAELLHSMFGSGTPMRRRRRRR